jgi:NTP pyrophosphatase (non-canonical NTP hydrolase)
MNKVIDIEKMLNAQRKFSKDRDWDQFHTPKNLAIALNVEASELMEIFQWLKDDESKTITDNETKAQKIKEEMADVLYYLIRMADILKIDLEKEFWNKLTQNEAKYPIEKSHGNAKKYTEF